MAGAPVDGGLSRPRLSVCLIVKDEADFIEDCLASVGPLADELVVVDTGSTDDTVALARAAGAQVHHFTWIDDFAAARNAALGYATGEFVLHLDADERLSPEGRVALQTLLTEPGRAEPDEPPTVYLPQIVNIDARGQMLGADYMPRLWRQRADLRFEGRVHEQVKTTEGKAPRLVFLESLRIIHLGYDPDLQAARGKHERNVKLLEAELAQRPDDPALIYYLAKQRYAVGEDAAAAELFARVVADGSVVNFTLNAALFGAECLRAIGQPEAAFELARLGLKQAPDYGALAYVAGEAALEAGAAGAAIELLASAHSAPTGAGATAFQDPTVARWRANLALADALTQMPADDRTPERARHALTLLDQLTAALPGGTAQIRAQQTRLVALVQGDQLDTARVLAQSLITANATAAIEPVAAWLGALAEARSPEGALNLLESLVQTRPALLSALELPDLAARLAEAAGDQGRQLAWLKLLAAGQSPVPSHYLDLARLLTDAGELEAAAAAARAAAVLMGHSA